MSKPVILAVDDDPQVLAAVLRDLRPKYAEDYQILGAASGEEGLEAVAGILGRGRTIALFLVDQRMPKMTGTEFLLEAQSSFPEAKKLLLTAYADTEAAIQAINDVGLDHYLMKPWEPPEERLYPTLDDVLADWRAATPPSFDGVRVVGTSWSPATHEVKDFLARNEIPYRFLDIERDPDAAAMASAATGGSSELPVVFLPDGTTLVRPDRRVLAGKIGLHIEATRPFYDLVIVGGGPAGLAAAVYGASEGLKTALIEREATGGQAGTSSRIENYLGFPKGISGADLARRATAQASRLGAEIVTATEVSGIRVGDQVKTVTLANGSELKSRALLIASGMTLRRLDVPGYEQYEGAGVFYGAAATEAATYRDRDIFVIGGANSAGQGAMMFSKTSKRVTLVVRSESLGAKMSQYLVDQIEATDNIEVLLGTKVLAVTGDQRVEKVRLLNTITDEDYERDGSALFIFVGAVPHSSFVEGTVARNEQGFVITGPDVMVGGKPETWDVDRDPYLLETSVPGIFAAGDVRQGAVRRVASAVGEGSVSVTFVHQYLTTV